MKKIFLTAAGIMLLAAACNARPDTSAKQTPLVQQQKSSDADAVAKDTKGEQQATKDTQRTAPVGSSKSEISKQQTPPPAAAAPQPKTVTVTITSSGFQPQEVTIKKGDSVKWVNQSGAGSWPASSVHPTHTVYPTTGGCLGSTFDACQSIGQNESWTFKFDHTGSWNYHDHLTPSRFGRVVVQ